MMQATRLDQWARGWRGPLLAALAALFAGLPGALFLPPLDRDESRFTQATAQMLETGDFVEIRFQDQPRDKKPVGIHWLQAASVAATSSAEARNIFAYRIPSLLGAMLAAAACAWGAAAFFGAGPGLIAGLILAATFLLSTEAGIAKTDAVLCGTTVLAMAALARLYAASIGLKEPFPKGESAGWRTRLLFWLGIGVGMLDKGPVGPMVVLLAGLSLWGVERRAPWAARMGWAWGLILVLAIVGPWAAAITVKTDGAFWGTAIGGDVAPKLKGGQEGHGAPFGLHFLLSPLLFFPAGALLPAALIEGWKGRKTPGARMALCWLIPGWLVFEITPTKLVHYTLPLYGALAWLAVFALGRAWGTRTRWTGAALSLVAGLFWTALPIVALIQYGDHAGPVAIAWMVISALLAASASLAGAVMALSERRRLPALGAALGLGLLAHGAIAGGLAPRLGSLWLSGRIVALLDQHHLNPRGGLAPGPVTVIGYGEPSLIFALGTETEIGDAGDGGEAIAEGRPVVVEQRAMAAFQQELAADNLKATALGQVKGVDYSSGKKEIMTLFRSDSPPPASQVVTAPTNLNATGPVTGAAPITAPGSIP
ncbi:MAG: glycosyltransferase family 39 protein [Caulobacteraceae bacterium]|nr:glycosyltransferase family 39 protein [Caulobacteraceae bacterium]